MGKGLGGFKTCGSSRNGDQYVRHGASKIDTSFGCGCRFAFLESILSLGNGIRLLFMLFSVQRFLKCKKEF